MAFLAIEVWREWSARDATIARAHAEMANLAASLRQHADDTFLIAEMALAGVSRHFETNGFGELSVARSAETMRAALGNGNRIRGLYIFDADGNWVLNSLGVYPEGVNNADRAYFQHHRDTPGTAPLFSPAVVSRTDGQWVMTLSRRINTPEGRFAGVAAATFTARSFAAYYETFSVGPDGAIALIHQNGQIISRVPYDEAKIGTSIADSAVFRTASEQNADRFRFVSPLDGQQRLGGLAYSERHPVRVIASTTEEAALADWRTGALERLVMSLGLVALGVFLALRLLDQVRERRRGEAALRQKEAEFRLLAESASDLIERFDLDGIRRYVSPSAKALLGHEPEDLIGTSVFDIVLPQDLPIATAAGQRLREGISRTETITCRVRHKDGHAIWLEASMRSIGPEDGSESGAIAVSRDVTDRKEMELRLARMASQDGLTGLGNRRSFDAALQRQTAVAREGGRPISLLLIDVDCFKLYNDEYGHQAGDACLKSVSSIVAMAAKRPGDHAARYGGEELAVILPESNAAEASFIAGEICRQIEALSIPHALNRPWGVATVSIGVSTITNRRGEPERNGDWLVSTADMALYQAKGEGRNRACSASHAVAGFTHDDEDKTRAAG